jgi:PAS domain S-box-containing protein
MERSWIQYGGVRGYVSERRNLEGAEDALGKDEESYTFLVQKACDVMGVLEADGTIRYVSPAVENMLGYLPQELIGTKVFDYVHPDDFERGSGAQTETLKTPGILPPMGFRARSADGSWRFVTNARGLRDVRDFPQALALNQEVLDWDLKRGATFNLAHNLGQMLHRRPRNRFEELDGVYLVGGW